MTIDSSKYDMRLSNSRWDALIFRIEHWLLSPGASDTAQLRGYLRQKYWRDCRNVRERLDVLKAVVKLPLRALRDSLQATRENGGGLPREHARTSVHQLVQLWWLWMRHGMHPEVYYAYQLYRPGHLRRAPLFLQGDESKIFRVVNLRTAWSEAELLNDKGRFERWLIDHGLPTVHTILELHDGHVVRSSLTAGALPPNDLFSKPNDALEGIGTKKWICDGESWADGDRRYTDQELLTELKTLSRGRELLVQPRLRNHSALLPIAPKTLSTVRVVTLRGMDNTVRVILAVCKIPTGDAPTDHMKYGGLAAPIDVATGRLSSAVQQSSTLLVETRHHHPDTGVQFDGLLIPHWQSVLELAMRAHRQLDRLICIGWDLAVLEDGPIIIEGNDNPGHVSFQLPTGLAVGETAVAETLNTRMRQSFGFA